MNAGRAQRGEPAIQSKARAATEAAATASKEEVSSNPEDPALKQEILRLLSTKQPGRGASLWLPDYELNLLRRFTDRQGFILQAIKFTVEPKAKRTPQPHLRRGTGNWRCTWTSTTYEPEDQDLTLWAWENWSLLPTAQQHASIKNDLEPIALMLTVFADKSDFGPDVQESEESTNVRAKLDEDVLGDLDDAPSKTRRH